MLYVVEFGIVSTVSTRTLTQLMYLFLFILHLFACFSIPFHSARILPLRFHARCRRRRL